MAAPKEAPAPPQCPPQHPGGVLSFCACLPGLGWAFSLALAPGLGGGQGRGLLCAGWWEAVSGSSGLPPAAILVMWQAVQSGTGGMITAPPCFPGMARTALQVNPSRGVCPGPCRVAARTHILYPSAAGGWGGDTGVAAPSRRRPQRSSGAEPSHQAPRTSPPCFRENTQKGAPAWSRTGDR